MLDKILNSIAWEKSPLIPTIAQDSATKRVLMLAYTNRESLEFTLKTHTAHYFSRSKNRIWRKGETSGNVQKVREIYIDCDNDAILFVVEQSGNACHTGELSCFFKKIDLENLAIECEKSRDSQENPYHAIDALYHILQERKNALQEKSYTAQLYAKGENEICKKIIEEASEVTFALKDFVRDLHKSRDSNNSGDKNSDSSKKNGDALVYESADLIYHLLVGLSYCNINPERVMSELKRRFGISGIAEKNARKSQ